MAFHAAPEARGTSCGPRARLLAAVLACLPVPAPGGELGAWAGPAPALELDALDGRRLGLGDFAGRPVLVHFFATWCEPCVAELGALDRLAATGRVAVLAVDVGEVDARVRRFFEEHPAGFPVLLDRNRDVTRGWGVVALPSSFLLDAGHAAAASVEGDLPWDDPDVLRQVDRLIKDREVKEDEPT